MSDPFSSPSGNTNVPRHTWSIAGLLVLALALGLAVLSNRRQQNEAARAQALAVAAAQEARQAAQQAETLQTQLTEQQENLRLAREELARQELVAAASQASIEAEMRAALESRDVTISELQGRLTVSILDRVLFDSGEAAIKPEGMRVLRQIAGVVAQYTNRAIHVVGHTDNVPIRSGARAGYHDNWELSSARALAAVRFLQEQAGVDPRRLAAVGMGEFHPVADNTTPEGRARNRRIAIVVQPEETGLGDTPPRRSGPLPAGAVTPTPSLAPGVPVPANAAPTNAIIPVPETTPPPAPAGTTTNGTTTNPAAKK